MKNLILLPFIIFGLTSNATNYFFSTASGDDSRTAAQAQNPATPWKTLSKLNSFFGFLNPGDSVLLNRGDVFYGSITINKSGVSGSPIIIGAYGTGEKPLITGFTTVGAWINPGSNIWESTSAVSALNEMNMVVINGVNTAMGRYPNTGYLTYQSHSGATSITSSSLNSATTNWTGAEAVIRKAPWVTDRNFITANSGSTLTYKTISGAKGNNNYGFYIQNDSRTLDTQNEWYYNPSTKKIRIYSTSIPTNVQVSTKDDLVYMLYQNHITFDNLSFQGSNKRAFVILSSANITIQNCNIDYSGQDAIFGAKNWGSPSSNFVFKNSTINHTNNNAINLADEFKGALISKNIIQNTGINDGMGGYGGDTKLVAIQMFAASSIIEYNTIDSVGYIGITFEGDNVIIRNNFITNFCTQKIDGAGIYTWWGRESVSPVTGQKIYNNIVLNGIGSIVGTDQVGIPNVHGIYLDDGIANVEVYGNTSANNSHTGLYLHNTSNCNIYDNTLYNNGVYQQLITSYLSAYPTRGLTLKNNISFSKTATQKTSSWETLVNENDIASFGTAASIDSNYYARPMDDNLTIQTRINDYETTTQRTLAGWLAYSAFDSHSNRSPKTITDINDLRFEYNATTSPVVVPLPSNYMDVRGTTYNGTITLAPHTSAVLIKNGAITNLAPKANAGPDQTIILPYDSIILSGSATDTDGTISSYLWTKIAGPAAYAITNNNSDSAFVTGLVQGVYQFELKVTDNKGTVGKDTIEVTVNASANITHIANARTGSTITLPVNTTSLPGSGIDAGGTIAGYAWRRASSQQLFFGRAGSALTFLNNLVQENLYVQVTRFFPVSNSKKIVNWLQCF